MSVVLFLDPQDCDPPHGLDLSSEHDWQKCKMLAEAFMEKGFDFSKSALVGYPYNGRIQLLSGTHRHQAALWTGTKLPVTPWLRSDVEMSWGLLEKWLRVMRDIPVLELLKWTREDLERSQLETSYAFDQREV